MPDNSSAPQQLNISPVSATNVPAPSASMASTFPPPVVTPITAPPPPQTGPSPAALQAVLESNAGSELAVQDKPKAPSGLWKWLISIPIFLMLLTTGALIGYRAWVTTYFLNLSELQRTLTMDELKLLSRIEEKQHGMASTISEKFWKDFDTATLTQIQEMYRALESSSRDYISDYQRYETMLRENAQAFKQMEANSQYLFGRDKEIAATVLNKTSAYYDSEIESTKLGIVLITANKNMALMVRDVSLLNTVEAASATMTPKQGLSQLASLRTYKNSAHAFEYEAEIEKKFPTTYRILNISRAMLRGKYKILEAIVQEDAEALTTIAKDLENEGEELLRDELNFEDLDGEMTKVIIDHAKTYGTAHLQRILALYEARRAGLGFPGLGVPVWETQAPTCYALSGKLGWYVFTQPDSKVGSDLMAFIEKTDEQEPKLGSVLNQGELNEITLSDGAEKITLTCTGNTDATELNFFNSK